MNKSPAFQFYPRDFLSDVNVSTMTMEERGIYITLLCHCWLEGYLKGSSRLVQDPSNKTVLTLCFYIDDDGNYRQKRLEEEREKQDKWKVKCSQGGVKSGEIRKMKGSSRVVEVNGNSSSSSSSSFIIVKKEKRKKISISQEERDYAFGELWNIFKKQGSKENALDKFNNQIKTDKDLFLLEIAVDNFLKQYEKDKSWKNLKHLEFFLTQKTWRGYIPDDAEERWQSELKLKEVNNEIPFE